MDAGEFSVRGNTCTVSDLQKTYYRVRAHWLPYFLPNEVITNNLVASDCKVIAVLYDKSSVEKLKNCASNLHTFIVETHQPANIPHFVDWNYHGMGGRSLLTMMGRKPTCLRCSLPGYVRKHRDTPYCRRCKRYWHDMDGCMGGSWAGAARQEQTEADLIEGDVLDTAATDSSSCRVLIRPL